MACCQDSGGTKSSSGSERRKAARTSGAEASGPRSNCSAAQRVASAAGVSGRPVAIVILRRKIIQPLVMAVEEFLEHLAVACNGGGIAQLQRFLETIHQDTKPDPAFQR